MTFAKHGMVDYTDVINEISQLLFKAISEREPDLRSKVHELDRELYKLLRGIGLQVVSMLLAWLSSQLTQEAKTTGLVVHRPTCCSVPRARETRLPFKERLRRTGLDSPQAGKILITVWRD